MVTVGTILAPDTVVTPRAPRTVHAIVEVIRRDTLVRATDMLRVSAVERVRDDLACLSIARMVDVFAIEACVAVFGGIGDTVVVLVVFGTVGRRYVRYSRLERAKLLRNRQGKIHLTTTGESILAGSIHPHGCGVDRTGRIRRKNRKYLFSGLGTRPTVEMTLILEGETVVLSTWWTECRQRYEVFFGAEDGG